MTVEIGLSQGRVALVDDDDAELVRPYNWFILVSRGVNNPLVYARAKVPGSTWMPLMHNFITGWALVDHLNGDGLDNRRANLRAATRSQNMGNRRKYKRFSSGYKGVSVYPQDRTRWLAKCHGVHLGIFTSEVNAAIAYDIEARAHFGEFAALNFPGPGERGALVMAAAA